MAAGHKKAKKYVYTVIYIYTVGMHVLHISTEVNTNSSEREIRIDTKKKKNLISQNIGLMIPRGCIEGRESLQGQIIILHENRRERRGTN